MFYFHSTGFWEIFIPAPEKARDSVYTETIKALYLRLLTKSLKNDIGAVLSFVYLSVLCPGNRSEGYYNRENFESAEQHSEGKHDFCKRRVASEATRRAYRAEARAYIIKAGDRGGEVGFKIKWLKA